MEDRGGAVSIFEVLDRIKPTLPAPPREESRLSPALEPRENRAEPVQQALIANANGRTVITVPVETAALNAEDFITRVSGRLVGADQPNSNKQYWTTADLEFGLPSVAGGPLNWLHDEKHIVGALTAADLMKPAEEELREAAAKQQTAPGPHIKADSVMWSYIYPGETRIVQEAARSGSLYYSMECISKSMACVGCGHEMDYMDCIGRTERACAHIRDRAAARRFINPVFQGAALIVPPIKPGWKDANAEVLKRAAANEQLQQFADGNEALAAQILEFITAPRP